MDTFGCVMATVNLPDAEENDSKQSHLVWHDQLKEKFDSLLPVLTQKYFDLNSTKVIDLWHSRSGRSIV